MKFASSKAASVTMKEGLTSSALPYHAKLCVFADRYLISDLQVQCLANLYKVLINLDLDMTAIDFSLRLKTGLDFWFVVRLH